MESSSSAGSIKKSDSWSWEDYTEPKVPSPRSRRNSQPQEQQHIDLKRQCTESQERGYSSDYYIGDGSCSNRSSVPENLNTFNTSSSDANRESAYLDRPPRPPFVRKTSSKSPIYIEKGGVLISESTYINSPPISSSSSTSSIRARTSSSELIHKAEDTKSCEYLSKNIKMSTLGHIDSCESMDEILKGEEKRFNEFHEIEDKSTKPGQGLVESFLSSLNPLDWIEWHYEYCNAPARRQHIISSTKKEVSNFTITADQASILPCVVSPGDAR